MASPRLLVTGFGTFEGVDDNPSGRVAAALDGRPGVHGVVLPVTFRGAPAELERVLARFSAPPEVILATGVHPGSAFRLERRARARMGSGRPDNEGVSGDALDLETAPDRTQAPDLETGLDLDELAEVLRGAGADDVMLSDDAGGYVCECVYRRVLEVCERERVRGLFLHVPPLAAVPFERQLAVVERLAGALLALSPA